MSQRDINQGIQAIQNGNTDEGARLLRVGLKDDDLSPRMRATAWLWLAETRDDTQFKIDCYRKAQQADPNYEQIDTRLSKLLSQQLPSNQQSQQSQQRQQPTQQGQSQQQPTTQSQSQNPQPRQSDPYNPEQQNQQQWQNDPFNQGNQPPQQQQNQQPQPQQDSLPYQQQQQQSRQQQQPSQQSQQQYNQGQQAQQPPPPPQQGQQSQQQQQQQQQQPQQQYNQGQQAQQPPPPPQQGQQSQQQSQQQQTIDVQGVQRSVGILGGPNGRGTGFFVTREGLVVTTRYVVGGNSNVDVELLDGRQVRGQVVRSYPDFDIAFVQTAVRVSALLNVAQNTLPDDATIVAVTHTGEGLRSSKRATRHQTAPHWFPTLINRLLDAGGNPIFNANNLLVGMLTRNMSRTSGYLYGLYISKIYQCVQQYLQETRQLSGDTIYCSACGIISRAPNYNAYYCEHCGRTHPYAADISRYPQDHFVNFYREDTQRACPNCESRVGFYDGTCLRCGHEI